MKSFITLEESIDILNDNISLLGTTKVNLLDSLNQVLAEDIYSKINIPPFNKSAMDGYALRSSDIGDKVAFKIIGEVFAGSKFKSKVGFCESVKITTGAPIPEGADCVIKQEDVSLKNDHISLNVSIKKYENVCFQGEDIKEGQILVKKGKKINYSDIGIMSSSGINFVKVYKTPRIGFISTGDEVLDIDKKLSDGKIYNSNKYSILARLDELRYKVSSISHVKDDDLEIGKSIENLSNDLDVIITTGGASVGEKDLIKKAIENIDGEVLFWKVKIKPGSAVVFSRYKNTLVISLSGNPIAALTTFELLVRTSLDKMSGMGDINILKDKAIILQSFDKASKQRRFIRGKSRVIEGKLMVDITQNKSGNGILSSTIDSNCLIDVSVGNEGIKLGEVVNIIRF